MAKVKKTTPKKKLPTKNTTCFCVNNLSELIGGRDAITRSLEKWLGKEVLVTVEDPDKPGNKKIIRVNNPTTPQKRPYEIKQDLCPTLHGNLTAIAAKTMGGENEPA